MSPRSDDWAPPPLDDEQRRLLKRMLEKHGLAKFDAGDEPAPPPAPDEDWLDHVSVRELEVLQLMADGLTTDEIAARLFISKETVKTHTRNLLQKLRARNRTHAVSNGYRTGLLDLV